MNSAARIEAFLEMMSVERGAADNTLASYRRDLDDASATIKGGLADATVFRIADGLSWPMGGEGGRTRTEPEMGGWRTARGAAGRIAPRGFPQNILFSGT